MNATLITAPSFHGVSDYDGLIMEGREAIRREIGRHQFVTEHALTLVSRNVGFIVLQRVGHL